MATKLIDFIQSEQIVKLEEDVNILKNALNLMIGDINQLAPRVTSIVSNLNSVVSSIGNNYIPLTVSVPIGGDSNDHTDGTYTNVSLGGGSGSGAKATVVVGQVSNHGGGSIQSVTVTTEGTGLYLIGQTLTVPKEAIGNGSQNGNVVVVGNGTSVDGLLKRLTEFDDDYTTHISRKFPPVVDIRGKVHVGYTENGTPQKHAHPEGWTGSSGTCEVGTMDVNPNYPGTVALGSHTNVYFVEKTVSAPVMPTNRTWEGQQEWSSFPVAALYVFSWAVGQPDFNLDIFTGNNPLNSNCSYGYGWSVDDEIMSMTGTTDSNGVWQSKFHGIITAVGTQLKPLPADNETDPNVFVGRSPHLPNAGYNINDYGDPPPGGGGPVEPADWGEGGSHHIMDPSNQLDDEEYITHVLNTTVVPSYLSQAQILFMSDEDKIKRAKQLVRMTKNRLHDDSIWQTKNVSDGVLTADDFIT